MLACPCTFVKDDISRHEDTPIQLLNKHVCFAIGGKPKVLAFDRSCLQLHTLIIRYSCPRLAAKHSESQNIRHFAREHLIGGPAI